MRTTAGCLLIAAALVGCRGDPVCDLGLEATPRPDGWHFRVVADPGARAQLVRGRAWAPRDRLLDEYQGLVVEMAPGGADAHGSVVLLSGEVPVSGRVEFDVPRSAFPPGDGTWGVQAWAPGPEGRSVRGLSNVWVLAECGGELRATRLAEHLRSGWSYGGAALGIFGVVAVGWLLRRLRHPPVWLGGVLCLGLLGGVCVRFGRVEDRFQVESGYVASSLLSEACRNPPPATSFSRAADVISDRLRRERRGAESVSVVLTEFSDDVVSVQAAWFARSLGATLRRRPSDRSELPSGLAVFVGAAPVGTEILRQGDLVLTRITP